MRDMFLKELKSICNEHVFSDEEIRAILDEANRILILGKMAIKEGLLALIDFAEDENWHENELYSKYDLSRLDDSGFDVYLKELIELVTEGTDTEIICSISEAYLCTSNFTPVEFIRYLIIFEGMLNIKYGTAPFFMERMIVAYLPIKAREKFFSEYIALKNRFEISPEETLAKKITRLTDLEKYPDNGATQNNNMYRIFMLLDDKSMQCLNKNINLNDLSVALKGMPGNLRDRFLQNLPKKQCISVIEDMELMGPVRMLDVEASTERIFKVLQRLEDSAQIYIDAGNIQP